ncbi:hypothetical protein JCM15640A_16830 [Hoylesella timonensis 4401737 = DSM 22865 = JCM 15640]
MCKCERGEGVTPLKDGRHVKRFGFSDLFITIIISENKNISKSAVRLIIYKEKLIKNDGFRIRKEFSGAILRAGQSKS